jgi:hypothetical protein
VDWLERLFGFSPDNGDGTVESLVMFGIAAAFAVAIAVTVAKSRARAVR